MSRGSIMDNIKIINSENGFNEIEPIKVTMPELLEMEDLRDRSIYFKTCKVGENNAMEIHIVCDKGVRITPIKGLIHFFVKKPQSVVGGIR